MGPDCTAFAWLAEGGIHWWKPVLFVHRCRKTACLPLKGNANGGLLRSGKREGNVLFNDAFYFRLYGVERMVKDHLVSERGTPLPPLHRLLLLISTKGSFICTIPQTGKHIPRSLLHQTWSTGWNEKWVHREESIRRPSHHVGRSTTELHLVPIAFRRSC